MNMRVRVKFAGPLRDAAGVKDAAIELKDGTNTSGALAEIARQFPSIQRELFGDDAKGYYSIFINDKLVAEAERQTASLADGDELLLLLPIAGGKAWLL